MAQQSLREALSSTASQPEKEVLRPENRAAREAIARESSLRYRQLVSELNRARDSEMERVLQRA
jgi:hypothetical protein